MSIRVITPTSLHETTYIYGWAWTSFGIICRGDELLVGRRVVVLSAARCYR